VEAENCGHDVRGPHGRPASRQWEPSECIAFAVAMLEEVAQKLCPDPGRVSKVVGKFTADLERLAAGDGPCGEIWPESLLPRRDEGEIWWPVWWCPGAGVEARPSGDNSCQEEAAPALVATIQGVPLAPGDWSSHADKAPDVVEGGPRQQPLPVQSPAMSVQVEAVVDGLPQGARRRRGKRRRKRCRKRRQETSSLCSGSGS
jgi:hypothetical protein